MFLEVDITWERVSSFRGRGESSSRRVWSIRGRIGSFRGRIRSFWGRVGFVVSGGAVRRHHSHVFVCVFAASPDAEDV